MQAVNVRMLIEAALVASSGVLGTVALCVKDRHLNEAGSASRIQRWLKPRWWHRYGVATVTGLAAVSIRRLLEKQGSFEVTTADGYDIGEALRRHPGRQNPCATDIDRFLPFFCYCGGILPASDRLDGVCVHSAPPAHPRSDDRSTEIPEMCPVYPLKCYRNPSKYSFRPSQRTPNRQKNRINRRLRSQHSKMTPKKAGAKPRSPNFGPLLSPEAVLRAIFGRSDFQPHRKLFLGQNTDLLGPF